MKCPFCSHTESQVLESRVINEGTAVRRRRECLKCGKRFTTHEELKQQFLWVIKKDGRRELFEREKLKRGILRAVEKRPVSLEVVEDIVDQIERELLNKQTAEVPTRVIGNAVMSRLKKLDKVAWLRFTSVYLEFTDLEDFEKLIEKK